ncbi:MAG: putative serine protease [Paenibacillus sp.]|nr:putative serine protease [Paenibacillus sp.]
MNKPLLIIVNGLPGTGKTTLSKRLSQDAGLPLFSRDGIYETLYDALDCPSNGSPPLLAPAAFTLLYSIAGSILSAGQSMMIEGFFGRPQLRTAELLQLKQACDFEPLQIMCRTDGDVLLNRFYARMGAKDRHAGHSDREWIHQEENKQRLLTGDLTPLALGGTVIDIDTTTSSSFDYERLLQRVRLQAQ